MDDRSFLRPPLVNGLSHHVSIQRIAIKGGGGGWVGVDRPNSREGTVAKKTTGMCGPNSGTRKIVAMEA